jgi:DNA-binding Lrp family transcriptional regulator
MAVALDEIDIRLLTLLQTDADVTNVELARLVGLSPAATLHRVRHLKESGVIRMINARLDPAAAGFALQTYVAATLTRHDPRASSAFEEMLRSMPQVVAADLVAGEMDYLITLVTRDVPELQQVLTQLAVRGGHRLSTYLKLQEVKAPAPLPLGSPGGTGPARSRSPRAAAVRGRSTGASTAMSTRATSTTDTARRMPTSSAMNPTSGGPARNAR